MSHVDFKRIAGYATPTELREAMHKYQLSAYDAMELQKRLGGDGELRNIPEYFGEHEPDVELYMNDNKKLFRSASFVTAWLFDKPKPRQNPLMKTPPALPQQQPKPQGLLSGIVSKVIDLIKRRDIRLDWNMYRDFLASKIFGKTPTQDLNSVAQTSISRSDPAVVRSLERSTPNPLEAIKAAISKMLSEDLSRYTKRAPAMAYSNIKVVLANIQDAGAAMDLITWIKKTIQDNIDNAEPKVKSFISYLQMVGDHYERVLSKEPGVREQEGLTLEQAKNYIRGVIDRHPEFKADMDALQNATEATFKDNK